MRCTILLAAWFAASCGGRTAGPVGPAPAGELEATPVVAAAPDAGPAPAPPAPPAPATPIADRYRAEADKILAAARADRGGWAKLAHLTDRIGARLSGSPQLEQAVAWAVAAMQADGHENVRAEKVMVPHWVRGAESAELIAPARQRLAVIGLGGTAPTPARGITAEVVVVQSFEELEALGAAVSGKIVLYNKAMPPYSRETGSGYGSTVVFRGRGTVPAARLGAVAVLVRSVTATSLRSPHTGFTSYEGAVKRIPAAAISTEDADLMARLSAAGDQVVVKLTLASRTLPDAASANVVAELRGRELPDEVVLIGAHLDSWDVGTGAHDDGAGCAMVMQALTLLRQLGLRPRRTIRVVLFTNEESGLKGARAYAEQHQAELGQHVAALESDGGGFAPRGFSVEGKDAAVAQAQDIVTLLAPIGAARARKGHSGADLTPLVAAGVPGLGLEVDGARYFDYHHSEADTLDKVDADDFALDVGAVAVMAYVLADLPERFGTEAAP